MKTLLLLSFLLLCGSMLAQDARNELIQSERKAFERKMNFSKVTYPSDPNYDVQYYKLDVSVTHTPKYIGGKVILNAKSSLDSLTSIKIDLQNTLTVDSIISKTKVSFQHVSDVISVQLEKVKSPVIHKFQKPTGVKLKISNKNKLLDYND